MASALQEAKKRARADYGLAAGAVLASVLFIFRTTIEDQLSRLHPAGQQSYPYEALHDSRFCAAFRTWTAGKTDLSEFQPVSAKALVFQRSAVAIAYTALVAVGLALLLRRRSRSGNHAATHLALVALFLVSTAIAILIDLSLVVKPGRPSNPYDAWFPALDWVGAGALILLGVLLLPRVVSDLRDRYAVYRATPASGRLALGAAIGFVILFNSGDIGAQLEDLLRRAVNSDKVSSDLKGAALIVTALVVYILVLKALGALRVDSGDDPNPKKLTAIGLAVTVVGAGVLHVGGQSALFVIGLIALAIGALSMLSKPKKDSNGNTYPPLARRTTLELRFAAALLIVAPVTILLGWRLGRDVHVGLLVFGAVAAVAGGALLIYRVLRLDSVAIEPAGAEAGAVIVLLGVVTMIVVPRQELAVHIGAGVAALGALVMMSARRSYRPRIPALDYVGVLVLAGGLVYIHARPSPAWSIGVALGVAGLVWLRVNRGAYQPVPWLNRQRADADENATRDADPTGVLLAAALLPIVGLLTVSVRVLGSALATGLSPPAVLGAFQLVLLALAVVGGWYLTRPTTPHVPGIAKAVLMFVAASVPAIALASVTVARSASMEVGERLGPLLLILFVLAWVAAIGGVVRLRTRTNDQPAVFRRLGFKRTPVIGIVLTWFALVVVAGAPIERHEATSHDIRIRHVSPARLAPPPCDDKHDVAGVLRSEDAPADLTDELCRWINRAMAASQAPRDGKLPLILVSASGGGVRAAAWTARVLDCLMFKPDPERGIKGCPNRPTEDRWPYVFAASGASGGSVGIATAAAEWIAPLPGSKPWARRHAVQDHLGPVSGQMLIAELGLAGFGVAPEHDRAETLIASWSRPFGKTRPSRCPGLEESVTIEKLGFLEAFAECSGNVPIMSFNGTVVRSGTRIDISPLDKPGQDEALGLRDVLCRTSAEGAEDIPFFQAAFASGRFPFVTPSGHIGYDRPDKCDIDIDDSSPVDIVDGGYHENSGAAPLADMWPDLARMIDAVNAERAGTLPEIVPILLRVENGEVDTPPRECTWEPKKEQKRIPHHADGADRTVRFGEPLRVVWAGVFARVMDRAEDDAGPRFARDFCNERKGAVVTIGLYEHPGRALPLGWTLTEPILDDLERVFALEPNQCRAGRFADLVAGQPPRDC